MDKWISVVDAIRLSGVSERTVRRWAKENMESTRRGKNGLLVNRFDFSRDYPFEEGFFCSGAVPEPDRQAPDTTQMQIISYSETITKLSDQIERRDNEIKLLLTRKSKLPMWLSIGFILGFGGLLFVGWITFDGYRREQSQVHANELRYLRESLTNEMRIREEYGAKIEASQLGLISDLKKEISDLKNTMRAEHKVSGQTLRLPALKPVTQK